MTKKTYVAGTLDTKGAQLRYFRDLIGAGGVSTVLVDLSTRRMEDAPDVGARVLAACHPGGADAVFGDDRGAATRVTFLAQL